MIVKASFAVYAADRQNISNEELKQYAEDLKSGIEDSLNRTEKIEGRTFVVKTDIKTKVFKSERAAMKSGSDNIVEIGNLDIFDADSLTSGKTAGLGFRIEGESFDRMVVSVKDLGGFGADLAKQTMRHEFLTHLSDRPHSNDPFSVRYGLDDSRGNNFDKGDLADYLGRGLIRVQPPPALKGSGDLASKSTHILTSTGSGTQRRRAPYAASHRNKVYHWVRRMKQ